jgi:hypothetical protein
MAAIGISLAAATGQKRILVAVWFRDKVDVLDKTRNGIKPLMEFKFPENVSRARMWGLAAP